MIALIISSCEKTDTDFHIDQSKTEIEGLIVLGEQLENPYSVENMKLAYEALRGTNTLKATLDIEATHLYVRFKPKNNQEQTWLTRDSSIYIYDYPLDHEIVRRGTYYHDPSIPSNEITWQYTVVPVDYDFPNIHSQILEELYLPHYTSNHEDDDDKLQIESSNWQALETEALLMTGNLNENDQSVKKATEWRPSGNIKVHDDEIGSYTTTNTVFDHWEYYDCDTGEPLDPPEDPRPILTKSTSRIEPPEYCQRAVYRTVTTTVYSSKIPIEGVDVRARNWFTTYSDITDANGDFRCNGTFSGDVNYSIKWENDYFDIRDGAYGQAYYNGPEKIGSWNLVIEESSTPKSFLFAHIYRAGYTYYFKNNLWGIKKPTNFNTRFFGLIASRLHIGGRIDSPNASHYFDFNELWQAATVLVHQNGRNSRGIFNVTIHELAHASHWEIVGTYDINWLINNRIAESWASGVDAKITADIYGSTNPDEIMQNRTIYYMTEGAGKGYTCIVWDLMDDHNQFGTNPAYPNDQVKDYTLSQIEFSLPMIFGSWSTWCNRLIDNFDNATEEHVEDLFDEFDN